MSDAWHGEVRITLAGRGVLPWMKAVAPGGRAVLSVSDELKLMYANVGAGLECSAELVLRHGGPVHSTLQATLLATRALAYAPHVELLSEADLQISVQPIDQSVWLAGRSVWVGGRRLSGVTNIGLDLTTLNRQRYGDG